MPARAYHASGLSHPGALSRFALTCLVAGLAGGMVEGFVSRWISLLLLFPALLGLIVGIPAMRIIERTHIRAPLLCALVAGVAGLFAQGALIGTQYYQFRVTMRGQFEGNEAVVGMIDRIIDAGIEQETGHGGFVGYLKIRARSGTEVKNSGSSSGIKLSGAAFWALFALNFLIAGGIAAGMAWDRAREPYCEACHRWYDRTEDVASGSADKSAVAATLSAIDRQAFSEVPSALLSPKPGSVSSLRLLRCRNCSGHEPQLTMSVVTGIGKKQKTKRALTTMLRPEAAKSLIGAFEKKS